MNSSYIVHPILIVINIVLYMTTAHWWHLYIAGVCTGFLIATIIGDMLINHERVSKRNS